MSGKTKDKVYIKDKKVEDDVKDNKDNTDK